MTEPPEPTLVIVGKKRGRPRVSQEPSMSVSTWLPKPYVDRLCQLAHKHRMSLSAVTRKIVILGLKKL